MSESECEFVSKCESVPLSPSCVSKCVSLCISESECV